MKLSVSRFLLTSVGLAAVSFIAGSLAGAASAQPAPSRAKPRTVAAPVGGKTSFHFDNIPVRSALQLIAEEGRFNLIVSDSVQGNISLRLNDVTWEQALDIVLRIKHLQQHVDGDNRSVGFAGAE